jgi:hypothetical protein
VVPVSPGSFYAYLQVIALGLRGFQIEENARRIMEDLGRMRGDIWNGSPTNSICWAGICPTPKPNTTTPTAAWNDFKTNCPPSPMPPPPCLQSLSFPHFLRIVDQPPAGPGSALFPKASISRHPGESRDPVCEIVVDIRFKPWIPAFAGMTEIGENRFVETGGLWELLGLLDNLAKFDEICYHTVA